MNNQPQLLLPEFAESIQRTTFENIREMVRKNPPNTKRPIHFNGCQFVNGLLIMDYPPCAMFCPKTKDKTNTLEQIETVAQHLRQMAIDCNIAIMVNHKTPKF